MTAFRLLLVEDSEDDIRLCKDTLRRYEDQKGRKVELVECRDLRNALLEINKPLDGAIVDLKLAERGDEGNAVVSRIQEEFHRIPVAILTATPDSIGMDQTFIGIFRKGERGAGYDDLLDRLWEIYDTGLTRIMGGRGIIEKMLSDIFRRNILPQKDAWIRYGIQNSKRTERALLRHILGHITQSLDTDEDVFLLEEVYLAPPISENTSTGWVVKEKSGTKWYVVLTPACDLALREGGKTNTDWIQLVEIDDFNTVLPGLPAKGISQKQEDSIVKSFKNGKACYHWLPPTSFFAGGFANFRKIKSQEKSEFINTFDPPLLQISPNFVKDMIARFASYYARQGQPELDHDALIASMKETPPAV